MFTPNLMIIHQLKQELRNVKGKLERVEESVQRCFNSDQLSAMKRLVVMYTQSGAIVNSKCFQ